MRVVILGSGRGSNAEAILEAQQAGQLGTARVVQILSDKPDVGHPGARRSVRRAGGLCRSRTLQDEAGGPR
jgi:folate-dependent phosphoribosylglycinamide formyltransferase PurN